MRLTVFLASLLLSANLVSQEANNDFNIDADKWEKNFRTGETLFTGNVKMRHGAFLIEAESLVTYQKDNILEKAIAQGEPAVFQQLPGEGQELVNASGNKIEFVDSLAEQSVKITQNALLKQDGITAVCNEITFILENGVVQYLDGSRGDSQCQVSSNGTASASNTPSNDVANDDSANNPQVQNNLTDTPQ